MSNSDFVSYTIIVMSILVFILLQSCFPSSRTNKTENFNFYGRYAEFYEFNEIEIRSSYQYVYTKIDNSFILRRFFPETKTLTLYKEYSDEKYSILDGLYKEYWDHGEPKVIGAYKNNKRSGLWEYFNFDNSLRSRGGYQKGMKTGEWREYHSNGKVKVIENYIDGELNDLKIKYDSSGVIVEKVEYRNGVLFETYINEDDNKVEEKFPLFPGCPDYLDYEELKNCAQQRLLQFIYKNVKFPPRARSFGVEGSGIVSFVIEADGKVTDIVVLNGLNTDITEELIRLVKMMPNWIPGEQNGKKVRVKFHLPIDFKLT